MVSQHFIASHRGAFLFLLLSFSGAVWANDPIPAAGTLSPATPVVEFTTAQFLISNESYSAGQAMCAPQPVFRCDDFALTVELPDDYAAKHPDDLILITTTWPDKTEDFDIYILDDQGADVGGSQAATGQDPEIAKLPAGSGTRHLVVRTVPFTVKGGATATKIELFSPPPLVNAPPPLKPSGPDPRYYVYASDGDAVDGGEPSIGYNLTTHRAMYTATGNGAVSPVGGQVAQINFPENLSPALPEACDADWVDVTPPSLAAFNVDGILVTDPATGRTFDSELLSAGTALVGVGGPAGLFGFNSIFAYSDDDGANWTQGGLGPPQTTLPPGVVGTQVVDGLDHQTVAVGPYAAGTKPATNLLYDNAVYYCSQGYIEAFCTRSDDGGLTFPSIGVVVYTESDNGCGGLHGHARVAPDGTVYLPNKNCHHHAAVAVSEDSGMHWEVREQPTSSNPPGGVFTDPQMALASDGTGYFCWVGDDGHPHVTVTKDKARTWINDYDIGYYAGIQNSVFPQAVAGDPDRAACSFIGTTAPGNLESMDFTGIWYLFVATTDDGGKTWHTVNATPGDPVQREGGIWLHGGSHANRNLLDFNEITMDEKGRPLAVFADGCVGPCVQESPNSFSARPTLARMSGGKSLLAAFDPPAQSKALGACLGGVRDQNAAHLSWRVPDNGGAEISGYKIYRGLTPELQILLTQTSGPKPAFDDTSADAGVANYSYKVTAVNAAGEGQFSNIITLPVVTLPAVQTPCTLPGVTVATDPSGDNTDGPASTDVRALSVAEPGNMDGKLVFTLKVESMTATPPSGFRWVAYFNTPTPLTNGDENYYVAMVTDAGTPAFEYGTSVAVSPAPGSPVAPRTYHKIGSLDASSAFSTDGSVVMVLDKSAVAPLNPGDRLTDMYGSTRSTAPGPAGGQGLTLDSTDTVGYTLRAADACIGGRGPLAALVSNVLAGPAPLHVDFDGSASSDPEGDTISSYTFDFGDGSASVTQSDAHISHTYARDGRYPATLKVTNSHGTESSNVARVLILVGGVTAAPATADLGRFGGALAPLLLLPLLGFALRRRQR